MTNDDFWGRFVGTELRWESFRGGTPRQEAYVKLIHEPSGIVIEEDSSLSQFENRRIAIQRLEQALKDKGHL